MTRAHRLNRLLAAHFLKSFLSNCFTQLDLGEQLAQTFQTKSHLSSTVEASIETLKKYSSRTEFNTLKNRIAFINSIHDKLKSYQNEERRADDCTPLVADYYNLQKTFSIWNKVFGKDDFTIRLPIGEGWNFNLALPIKQFTNRSIIKP